MSMFSYGGFETAPNGTCLRCGEAPATDAEGLCGHCHWALKEEINRGLDEVQLYVDRHAAFDEWCADNGARDSGPAPDPQERQTATPEGGEEGSAGA